MGLRGLLCEFTNPRSTLPEQARMGFIRHPGALISSLRHERLLLLDGHFNRRHVVNTTRFQVVMPIMSWLRANQMLLALCPLAFCILFPKGDS